MNGLFFGKRKRGKSTLSYHVALGLGLTVSIFDTNRQFKQSPESVVSDGGDLEALLHGGSELVIFRPGLDVRADFERFASTLWNWRDLVILLDENSRLQGGNWLNPWLDDFIRRSDSETVHLLQTLHRPSDAANICRALASDWFIFQTTQPASLAAIADQCGGEVAEKVTSLGVHEYVHYNDDSETWELVTDAASWFESLEAPAFPIGRESFEGEVFHA